MVSSACTCYVFPSLPPCHTSNPCATLPPAIHPLHTSCPPPVAFTPPAHVTLVPLPCTLLPAPCPPTPPVPRPLPIHGFIRLVALVCLIMLTICSRFYRFLLLSFYCPFSLIVTLFYPPFFSSYHGTLVQYVKWYTEHDIATSSFLLEFTSICYVLCYLRCQYK